MSEDSQVTTTQDDNGATLTIPEETAKKFPDLIELIKESHSMDDEERQYWIDVLPIMSDEQVKNLQDILDNEKQQIEEANKAYAEGMNNAAEKAAREFDEAAYLEKKKVRVEAEQLAEKEEQANEEALLEELDNL